MKSQLAILLLFTSSLLFAQAPEKSMDKKEKVLYTVGYAHLDTEWNWDYPTTINVYIKNTIEENFRLFEKYPDYVFNFTGSRRYHMMKEYYPELYSKVVSYVKQGRWNVSGSSVDEGEVNVSSPESVLRQVLYGNRYFQKEFGKISADYMLPDCFGFQANMPSIWHHAGLLGFSTQKLTWRGAVPIPYNVGVWNGPDDKGIIAVLNATNYEGRVQERLDTSSYWLKRMDENLAKFGYGFDYRYYGVGDEGGGARENDVIHAVGSLRNADSKIKVKLTSSDQMYKDITPEIRASLPVYKGDLLLIEHSSGSQTSQAFMKRANRKNELLASSAEQAATISHWLGATAYPQSKINNAWDLVLGSQFHDILPGTSKPKAYTYAWNDEFVAANGFSEVLKHSVSSIIAEMNTTGAGRSLVVYNPVAQEREEVITAQMNFENSPEALTVVDAKGRPLPVQILEKEGGKVRFIFSARLPSLGFAVFDVREGKVLMVSRPMLKVSSRVLENEYYRVELADNGDIRSIYDKTASKEILASPARLEFQHEAPASWPSWNMDWNDRQKPPVDYLDKEAQISILESGPVRVALLVKRKGQNSDMEQVISLSTGESGKRVEVSNLIDWQSKEVSLKASFPLTVNNEKATYNLGTGTIQRFNNEPNKFEVPSREWFDLTDKTGKYGVTIMEDCKYASDKPADNTLRLTLLYTPKISESFSWCWYQGTQDWGVHRVRYALLGHKGNWTEAGSSWQARFFNQPPLAFETPSHEGKLGKEFSFLKTSSPQTGIMAVKKMEDNDYLLVRVNELLGKNGKNLSLTFPANIVDAYEVNGQEMRIGNAAFRGNTLTFDLSHYTLKSFAVKLVPSSTESARTIQQELTLPFNFDWITYDDNRHDCNQDRGGDSYPAELLPERVESEDIRFLVGNKGNMQNNVLQCDGQVISLPEGDYDKVYLLASGTKDTEGSFDIGGVKKTLKIQAWRGFIGQFYNRVLNELDRSLFKVEEPYCKNDNIAWYASHAHQSYPSANQAYEYCYLYKYALDIPKGAMTLTLPVNKDIRVFAMTLAGGEAEALQPSQPLFDTFSDNKPFVLRDKK